MKSAYEKAMERFGSGPVKSLSAEQKADLAAIDRNFQARIAEEELGADERRKAAGNDPEKVKAVMAQKVAAIAALRDKCEREKDKVRNAAG